MTAHHHPVHQPTLRAEPLEATARRCGVDVDAVAGDVVHLADQR